MPRQYKGAGQIMTPQLEFAPHLRDSSKQLSAGRRSGKAGGPMAAFGPAGHGDPSMAGRKAGDAPGSGLGAAAGQASCGLPFCAEETSGPPMMAGL